MPDNEARPLARPYQIDRKDQTSSTPVGLPISKVEQRELAAQLIDDWLEDGCVSTPILIPVLDRQSKQVLMFSIFENHLSGDPVGISSDLFECIERDGGEKFMPVQRTAHTRFWLDTLSWIHHERGHLILTKAECDELAQGELIFEESHNGAEPLFSISRKSVERHGVRPRF